MSGRFRAGFYEKAERQIADLTPDALAVCNAKWKTESHKRSAVYGLNYRTGDHAWKRCRCKLALEDVKELWWRVLLCSLSGDDNELDRLLSSVPEETVRDVHDTDGYRPTHHAAAAGNLAALQVLLDKGFAVDGEILPDVFDVWTDVTDVLTAGITPLHLAARHGHSNVVDLLLARGAEISRCAITGHGSLTGKVTAIQLAAGEQHLDLALKLYEAGANVEECGRFGSAVSCGGVAFARLLQDRGCSFQRATLSFSLMQLAKDASISRCSPIDPLSDIRDLLGVMSDLRMTPSPAALRSLLRDWRLPPSVAAEAVLLMVLYGARLSNESDFLLLAATKADPELLSLMLRLGWNAGSYGGRSSLASSRLLADLTRMSQLPAFAARTVNLTVLNKLQMTLADAEASCPSLKQWCRWTILGALAGPQRVNSLPLPKPMKNYLWLYDVAPNLATP